MQQLYLPVCTWLHVSDETLTNRTINIIAHQFYLQQKKQAQQKDNMTTRTVHNATMTSHTKTPNFLEIMWATDNWYVLHIREWAAWAVIPLFRYSVFHVLQHHMHFIPSVGLAQPHPNYGIRILNHHILFLCSSMHQTEGEFEAITCMSEFMALVENSGCHRLPLYYYVHLITVDYV